MKKCPYCAEEIQDEAIRCRYCRSDLAPAASTSPPPAAVVSIDRPGCLACGGPEVQLVSSIVAAGTWSSESQTAAVGLATNGEQWGVGVATAGTTSVGSTVLARLLAPPMRPVEESPAMVALTIVTGTISALLSVVFLGCFVQNIVFGTLGLFAAIGVAFTIFFWTESQKDLRKAEESHRVALAGWTTKIEKWKRLEYCSRCGMVSDRAASATAPAPAIQQLLAG